MSKHTWNYADAAVARTGLMICTACRKGIETGEFRYRETDDAYLPQHRSCSANDPEWAKIDALNTVRAERDREFVKACAAFKAKWGVSDLDDYLDDAGREALKGQP